MKPGTRTFFAALVLVLVTSACGGTAAPRPVRPVIGPNGWLYDTTTVTVIEQPAAAPAAENETNTEAPAAADNSTMTTSWMPNPNHPLGSGVNGCPTTPAEAAALFGGTADRWNQLDDPNKPGNEKLPGWSLAEARHSDTMPTFPYLFVPAKMRGDLWDNDQAWSVYGAGYSPFHVSEGTIWCWLQPGQAAPHPVKTALNAPR